MISLLSGEWPVFPEVAPASAKGAPNARPSANEGRRSANLFQLGYLHVLIYVYCLNELPVVHQWRHDPTAREFIQAVVENFVDLESPSSDAFEQRPTV